MNHFLQSLLHRLEGFPDRFGDLKQGVQKAILVADVDPEMSLTRSRKVLEFVVRDLYERRIHEPPGTRPLENLIQRLVKDGHFPDLVDAYATTVRKLGNVGTHSFGEKISTGDVCQSLSQLMMVLEWYIQDVKPEDLATPAPAAPATVLAAGSAEPHGPVQPMWRGSPDRLSNASPPGPPRPHQQQRPDRSTSKTLIWAICLGGGFLLLAFFFCGAGLLIFAPHPNNNMHTFTGEHPTVAGQADVPTYAEPPLAKTNTAAAIKTSNDSAVMGDVKPPTRHQGQRRLYFQEMGYSIVPPKGWTMAAAMPGAFLSMQASSADLLTSNKGPADKVFLPRLNARMVSHDGKPLEESRDQVHAALAKSFTNWHLVDESWLAIDGKKTYCIASSCLGDVDGRTMETYLLQYIVAAGSNKNAFILTFGADQMRFTQMRDQFHQSAISMQID